MLPALRERFIIAEEFFEIILQHTANLMQYFGYLTNSHRKCFTVLLLLLGLVVPPLSKAEFQQHIQINFSFNSQGKEVTSYRLYKEGELVCEDNTDDQNVLTCIFDSNAGKFDFTLTALYKDETESLHSPPFPFSLFDQSSIVAGLNILTGQQPQVEGLEEDLAKITGDRAVNLADLIHILRKAAPKPTTSYSPPEQTATPIQQSAPNQISSPTDPMGGGGTLVD